LPTTRVFNDSFIVPALAFPCPVRGLGAGTPTEFRIMNFETLKEEAMPRGDKSSYTDKQKRQAEHIEESEKESGKSTATAERIAWATVNKHDGGGKKKSSSK
jgi:hypothetical protein